MTTPDHLVRDLLPLLRSFCIGECGVAIGGSHAKECADELSDVDVYLFSDAVIPVSHRVGAVRQMLGSASQASGWGRDEP